jgi:mannose-6-phosphate isomerase-like protein (cupin superfamily)
MNKSIPLGMVLLLVAGSFGGAAGQAGAAPGRTTTPPPPAPAPGSAGIFRANADLRAALAQSIANGGPMSSASVTVTDQYRASMVRRTEPNGAIAHPGNTEMHYIVEGSGTVVTGGTVVRRDGAPAQIEGGEAHRVVKGDIIIIPAGSAHMYSEIVEPITYLEFRFVAPD